tara:strand:+ start:2681 stop:3424 length:744 start_codon:yes stop_codon:yes gene_type:complete
MKLEYLIVIPARINSTRLPRKLLMEINGISIIQRTYKRALQAINEPEKIIIATDSEEIRDHCNNFNAKTIMTSKNCLTGTDRVAEVAKKIKSAQYINLQGDEPIFPSLELSNFIKQANKDPSLIYTAITKIKKEEDYRNPSIPKMVFSKRKTLLYSSRAPIPSNKSGEFQNAYKHVCVYAFNRNHLDLFKNNESKTFFENEEDLEINRFLELEEKVKCIEISNGGRALDTQNDYDYLFDHINKFDLK